jgi:hypothetical protein
MFFLGTHKPIWLERTDVPLFVSRSTLRDRKTLPRARGRWALDSGAFSELDNPPHDWTITTAEYAAEVRRYSDEIGNLAWASPQDFMCEPEILAKTGRTLDEHLRLTVRNFLEVRQVAPDLPIIPVLQGWQVDDYLRCAELYQQAGVELADEPLVGLGTVCRRQATKPAETIVRTLAAQGFRLHGFGVKMTGLERFWDALASSDSTAWSYNARRQKAKCDRSGRLASCQNHLHYALEWRDRVMPLLDPDTQPLWKERPCTAAA